jgi:hypothetical protein
MMLRRAVAITLTVVMLAAFKLEMYELKRYWLLN